MKTLTHSQALAALQAILLSRQYSAKTEEAYLGWARRFLEFHNNTVKRPFVESDIQAFFASLETNRQLSPASLRQCKAGLMFFFKEVLDQAFPWSKQVQTTKADKKLPDTLSPTEIRAVLARIVGPQALVARLLYGCGLRLMEACQLRVHDVDFKHRQIRVMRDEGTLDRVLPLPKSLQASLEEQLLNTKNLHDTDLADGLGSAPLPHPSHSKATQWSKEWGWQYFFPADRLLTHPDSGALYRRHIGEQAVQRAIRHAAWQANMGRKVSPHTLRHSFGLHLMQDGKSIETVQRLMGHQSQNSTQLYLKIIEQQSNQLDSPLDKL